MCHSPILKSALEAARPSLSLTISLSLTLPFSLLSLFLFSFIFLYSISLLSYSVPLSLYTLLPQYSHIFLSSSFLLESSPTHYPPQCCSKQFASYDHLCTKCVWENCPMKEVFTSCVSDYYSSLSLSHSLSLSRCLAICLCLFS